MPGEIVDGMDPLAVFDCAKNAVSRARDGGGPTFIEAKTYRYRGHFLGDNPLRYRSDSEEFDWKKIDPIENYKVQLLESKIINKKEIKKIETKVKVRNARAAVKAAESKDPDVGDVLKYIYSDKTIF